MKRAFIRFLPRAKRCIRKARTAKTIASQRKSAKLLEEVPSCVEIEQEMLHPLAILDGTAAKEWSTKLSRRPLYLDVRKKRLSIVFQLPIQAASLAI